ncbi:DNA topoisomerase 2-binding protein 1 isoform X3 [Pseudomyrmex gracilis]|uniref:DNA topoisomerase 2-binding protein 1 isoform X3 n=1 Tax=Pseudomyrmex gracilis TaxID=219809 RepID=UPI00099514BD|nr:DNA topoisomerase 2-binding protein 1 isoform X3 [Pseudomyrmex gracilis]
MTTQESQIECDVNIHFVVPNHCKSENDCDEKMWQAFNKCNEYGLQPMWIIEEACNKIQPSKNDVFVMEEFKGDVFAKLRNFKCSRIVSPKCLLNCFNNGEPIPEGKNPIYTTAMRGMCICASGFSSENKDHIQQLVEYMGGFFTKQLRSSVTHLIADSVMSAKYECAIGMKIPIMTKEWIDAVWEANLKEDREVIKADDQIFDKYQCPVFKNLTVTTTNLSKHQKEELKRLIHDHGGTFMGPLDGKKVRVVLANENGPLSDKLKYAMSNDIACLKPDWVYESIKVGYALPFQNFIIKSNKSCSTPEKSNTRATLNCSNISTIPFEKPQNTYVNETLSSTISNFSVVDAGTVNFSAAAAVNVLDRLTFSEAKSAGPFLDGCNIYLTGFATTLRDKLNRILNVGCAMRLDDISDAVTHVIVGDKNKASAELKAIKARGLRCCIVSIEWLEESMKLKRPAPEERFLFEARDEAPKTIVGTPASPLSKKNLQMLQQPTRPSVPTFNLAKKLSSANEQPQSDLVQQYLRESSEFHTTTEEFVKPRTLVPEDKTVTTSQIRLSDIAQTKNITENDSIEPLSQSLVNEKLFKGLTFVVTGFEDINVKETIVMLGGRVVSNSYSGIPDYGVVPMHGASLKHTVNEIVTDLFIEDCINQERLVDVTYYHRPLSIKKSCSPLSECVITMSMYTGSERTYLSTLATKLGAICQDMFARKANAEKNTYGSTHLICPTPEGNKYNAAVRWKLPAVTAAWLITCAEQLTHVNETPFLVGETIAPDRSHLTNVSENIPNLTEQITPRTILTPKRFLSVKPQGTSAETPLINKRLSLVMNQTPKSPFHLSTPETPYGQVFKPDPSPDTRKGWVKWVDNFPDLQVTEPPAKRRAPSTPLSELKRQLWDKLKNPGQVFEKEDKADEATLRSDDSFVKKAEEKISDQPNKNVSSSSMSINRKLDFNEEDTLTPNKSSNEINMQIAELNKVLQRTSSTPENRYSLSAEKKYDVEASDHIQNCIVKDSQPIDAIVWEDPNHPKRPSSNLQRYGNNQCGIVDRESEENNTNEEHIKEDATKYRCESPITPKFMLSGIQNRSAYERIIKELGGNVSTDANFDNSATHLLCVRLSRNEKMLGSIAAGKWILYHSYLRDSEQEGRFLDEEEYEWGNPKSQKKIPQPNSDMEQAIATAAHRWRLKLQKEPDGPFSDMVALLMVSDEKYDQFKRLIEAGGGLVTQARPPYDASPSGHKITHCFVNVKQVNQPIDWAMLASKGILCFLPQYLSDYLTARQPLNPRECVLPEFKKYLTLLPK